MGAQNEWKPRHCTAIGRRLGRLTDRRTLKRDGTSRSAPTGVPRAKIGRVDNLVGTSKQGIGPGKFTERL
jgi:hypothetical protein